MTNKTYDVLKNISLLAVPVLAFLASLCTIWNVPYTEQITATLTEIETERFYDSYQKYTEPGGNSYIKGKVDRLKNEGKLA